MQREVVLVFFVLGILKCAIGEGFCSAPQAYDDIHTNSETLYHKVTNPTLSPLHLRDLPGFTRSVYRRDHALITPESHVFSPLPNWTNTLGAYLITPAMGSHFTMYLARMQAHSRSALPPQDVERFLFTVQGNGILTNASGNEIKLAENDENSWHLFWECDFVKAIWRR